MANYRRLLARAEEWYRGVQAAHPAEVPCARGCRDCCLGLFDISLADADLLREGLAEAPEPVRRGIRSRAADVMARLRARFPDLGATLEGRGEEEIDAICDALGPVECPALGPDGDCLLYGVRPLTCRLAGVPVVDRSGEVIHAEGCARCTLRPEAAPRLDYRALRDEEERLLRRRYGDRAWATLLIPQALET
ncbi:MAG: hypothetical protein HYY17_12155 [Planctomycetes bacterium]|nr:hypothetical protein [Planctomycetota bacterium]